MKQINDNKPFGRSYWVAPKKLLMGYTLGSLNKQKTLLKLTGLSRVGISHIINLIEEDEYTTSGVKVVHYDDVLKEYNSFTHIPLTYERLSIRDMSVPSNEKMKEILDSIDSKNAEGKAVYIHCHGGFGRSSLISCCFMKRHGIATNDNVFERLNHLRRNEEMAHRKAPQREIQFEFIRNFNE